MYPASVSSSSQVQRTTSGPALLETLVGFMVFGSRFGMVPANEFAVSTINGRLRLLSEIVNVLTFE